jgi:hypothetical protein
VSQGVLPSITIASITISTPTPHQKKKTKNKKTMFFALWDFPPFAVPHSSPAYLAQVIFHEHLTP